MILQGSIVNVIDNTGAKKALCIKVIGNGRKIASVGDFLVVSIKKCRKGSKIKQGLIFKALVVRTKYPYFRSSGVFVSFNDNSVILLNEKFDMLGTRINSLISKDILIKCKKKILSSSRYII
ncbi:uL14 family ribosomal protein [Candidatus Vidania fulgoroideorum]